MAPSKLSDADKQRMTELYCKPGATTSTLAAKFSVSSSTVSRVLKQQLSEEDYAQVIQWKRGGERGSLTLSFQAATGESDPAPAVEAIAEPEPSPATSPDPKPEPSPAPNPEPDLEPSSESSPDLAPESDPEQPRAMPLPVLNRRSRRRSTSKTPDQDDSQDNQISLPLDAPDDRPVAATPTPVDSDPDDLPEDELSGIEDDSPLQDIDIAADWDADALEDSEDYEDDYEDDEDDEDDEEDDWEESREERPLPTPRQEQLEILPFEQLVLQRPCYLVVDRLSELITCPLKEFSDLGLIPQAEEQARTLPVFDNHRIARRFSRRNQRIVKVPNGTMLTKTQQYLHAKGITRVLFDGQVYALS